MAKKPSVKHLVDNYNNTPLYKKEPNNVYGSYYYIHLHQEHVGMMGGQNPKTDSEMANIFNAYKYGKDASIADAVTNQYMELVQRSITDVGENAGILNSVFDTRNNNGASVEILDSLHEALKTGFEAQFTPNKVLQMLNISYNTRWGTSLKSNPTNYKDVQALVKVLEGNQTRGENQKGFAYLDKVLEGMAETVKLLNSKDAGALGAALCDLSSNRRYNTINEFGSALSQAIAPYKAKENGKKVKLTDLQEAAGYLDNIANLFFNGKNKEGKKITKDMVSGLVSKEFYPMMAEILATHISEASEDAMVKFFADAVERTGADPVLLELTTTDGRYKDVPVYMLNSYFNKQSKQSAEQGKADNKFNNVTVNLASIFSDMSGEIKMTVGISNKAYMTNYLGNKGLDEVNDVYGLGGGMRIGGAFDLFLGEAENIYTKYLGYNILAKTNLNTNEGFPTALTALQDVLLTRSIVYLAAGRTSTDFSQLILLNGKVMSMWDIVKYTLNNKVGLSSSQINSDDTESNEHGAYLSIPNRKTFLELAKEKNMYERVKKTNESIANSAMHLHIVPKKILKYAQTLGVK